MLNHRKNYKVPFFIYMELSYSSVIGKGIEAHVLEEFLVEEQSKNQRFDGKMATTWQNIYKQ